MSDSNKLTAAQLETKLKKQLAAASDTAEFLAERHLKESSFDREKLGKLWTLRETLRLALKWGF